MKIAGLDCISVAPRWQFLAIDTDAGITGWGEPVLEGRAATVGAAVEELSSYLIGKDPMRINDIWNVLYRGGSIVVTDTDVGYFGIDQALWDIKGKAMGQPVYQLLGGLCWDK